MTLPLAWRETAALLGKVALVALAYFATARFGLGLSHSIGNIAPIWPANAIVLAALLLAPRKQWPVYGVAAVLAAAGVQLAERDQLPLVLAYTVANVVEVFIAATVLRRLKVNAAITDSLRHLLPFLVPATMFAAAVSATIAAGALEAIHGEGQFWRAWRAWWIADSVGMLTLTPLLTSWLSAPLPRLHWRRLVEVAALLLTVLVTGYVAFGGIAALDRWQPVTPLLALPGLLWAAVRFGGRGATAANAAIAVLAIFNLVIAGSDYHADYSAIGVEHAIVAVQAILAIVQIITLAVAAALSDLRETERRERAAEAALSEAERRAREAEVLLRDAIESLNEGFVLFDKDDRLVLCNKRYLDLYAISADLLRPGAPFESILRESAKRGQVVEAMGRAERWVADRLAQHRMLETEILQQLGDGRWVLVRERRTHDDGTVSVHTDVSRLKNQELLMRDREFRLERMVDELGESRGQLKMLTQEMTRLAKENARHRRAAESANAAKSQFLANISHELRTPLNAIIGFSEMMQGETFGPLGADQYREYTGDIHGAGQHLLNLINDLLDLSKIEAGKFELVEDECDLPEIIEAAIHLMGERAQHAGVALESQIAPALPLLRGDYRKIKQILLNLLSNAIKFTPAGGSVTVAARLAEDHGLTLAVADSGIGIPPHELERVLEPFAQVENLMTRKHAGTGLGLPLCKALAELHGGQLTLGSTVGTGTTVTIAFPAQRSVALPSRAADASTSVA